MAQVKLDLRGLDVPGKVQQARLIVKGLRGNAGIPGGDALADALELKANALEANALEAKNEAQLEAKKAWGRLVDDKNLAETDFDTTYSSTGNAVQTATGGDEAKILSTNFGVRDAPSKAPLPGKILNLQATQGDDAGELDLHWHGLKEATSYASQIAEGADPNSAKWNYGPPIAGKRSVSQIKNLTSNQGYWMRVQGVNASGEGPWSDPVYKAAP